MKINLLGDSEFGKTPLLSRNLVNCYLRKSGDEITAHPIPGIDFVGPNLFPVEADVNRLTFQAAFDDMQTNSRIDTRHLTMVVGNRRRIIDLTDYAVLVDSPNFIGESNMGLCTTIVGATNFLLLQGDTGYYSGGAVVSANFPAAAKFGAYLDGRYIVNDNSVRGKFQISAIDDPSTWAALDFATENKYPDKVTGIKAVGQYLVIFGTNSITYWYNTQNPDFPFERNENIVLKVGCSFSGSIAELKETKTLFFIGNSEDSTPKIYALADGKLDIISTPTLEEDLFDSEFAYTKSSTAYEFENPYAISRDVSAYCLGIPGTFLYVLNIPHKNKTYYYDVVSKYWGQLKTPEGNMWPFKQALNMGGRMFLFADGYQKLMEMKISSGAFLGDPMLREIETKDIKLEYPGRHNYVEITTETGTSSSDNLISLEASNDYGRTWGSRAYRTLKNLGEYVDRVRWPQLGRTPTRRYRITYSGSNRFVLKSIYTEVKLSRRTEFDPQKLAGIEDGAV